MLPFDPGRRCKLRTRRLRRRYLGRGPLGSAADTPQPEATDAEAAEAGRRYRASQPATAPVAETASSALPDNEEFVFVRRDGTVFFAVAYAWEKGALRYITSQGLRRTVKQEALDLDATREFNEQRGLNFRLPA